MQIHGLVALSPSALFHETGIAALDLNAAACLLLDMLDVCTSMADDLGSEVEAWDRFKIDGNTLFGPFTLQHYQRTS